MLFNSVEFLLLFLPLVLGVFALLQRLHNKQLTLAWLCLASLFFYGWWNPVYLLLILGSAAVNFRLGRTLSEQKSRVLLLTGIVFNLTLLGYFKYFNWFIDSANAAFDLDFNLQNIVLPLAISFYTFQQITYLVDSAQGKTDRHSWLEYLLFVCFFPQLIAGPIVHHNDMLPQFRAINARPLNREALAVGLSILAIGLFKKVVLADGFAHFSDPAYVLLASGHSLHSIDMATASLAYAFQLYFDFSGYSDMAIGLACLFGIRLPVNFISPYRARNISDFWRTWHATLARFLRDYVYSPLGGFLCSPGRQRFNLFATMFLGGVWHGAGWTFVVYGLCHGSYVVIHQLWRIHVAGPMGLVTHPIYQHIAQLFTFTVVALTLVIFRAESLEIATEAYSALLNGGWLSFSSDYSKLIQSSKLVSWPAHLGLPMNEVMLTSSALLAALLTCWLLPCTQQLFAAQQVMLDSSGGRAAVLRLEWHPSASWGIYVSLLLAIAAMNLTQVSPFLYFQF